MDQILNFQDDLYSRIAKARTNFKKTAKDKLTKEYIEGRLEAVEHLWFEFLAGHKELMKGQYIDALKASSYFKNDMYDMCDELFLEYKTELKTKLSKFGVTSSGRTDSSQGSSGDGFKSNVKLPKVNIDSFSGQCYSDWTTFRDLFLSLIHRNVALDDVQKLLYLKGYLVGEAKQLLSSIQITHDNYLRAWKLLEDRYDNKRYVSNQILERLLCQKNIVYESANSLKGILDTTNDCLAALSNVGINTKNWDILVIHIVAKKLDPESRRQWEFNASDENASDELPTYKQFQEFLTKRYRALEFLDPRSNITPKSQSRYNLPVSKVKSMHVTQGQCVYCSEEHTLANCTAFKRNAVESRRNFVQANKICFNCLGVNHTAHTCKANLKCRICLRRHHTLLHPASANDAVASTSHVSRANESTPELEENEEAENTMQPEESAFVVSCFACKRNPILLATALVKTESRNGQWFTMRALLDQGSQSSFITEAMVQQLGLKKTATKIQITGIGDDRVLISKAVVNLKILSRIDSQVVINVKAHVLKSITTLLPTSEVKVFEWKELHEIALADPGYHTPNRIDMLLGAEVYGQILQEGVKKGPQGSPIAQCTSLGWILSGALDATEGTTDVKVMHIVEDNDYLKRFWELEDDIPMCKEKLQTNDEKRCEEMFAATTVRDEDGRYVVRLPFNDENPVVENSLRIAERRFLALEKRLQNTNLKQKYQEVINEYVQLSHMELVPTKEIDNPNAIYLPHHAVVREDKQTTKVRAVFDASCKGTNNKSLNDHLLIGPTLQADLKHLVMSWRESRICLTADIVKMYRQIKVNEADVDYQRILWRSNIAEEIKHYRMLRVTFGVSSAPYLAVKSLQQLSVDEGQRYPAAAKAVLSQFYMDDLLAGCENVEEGMHLYQQMNALVKKGGFSLQKWTSNSNELLQKMKQNEIGETVEDGKEGLKIKTDEVMKIVGLTWNRNDDSFRYQVDTPDVLEPATKRSIISEISRFYDPLGWVGPSIIISKMLIQKLWLAGLNWDDTAPENILNEWKSYKQELKMLTHVTIPRWIGASLGDVIELHGFSDASKDAYAAVVYSRVIDFTGQIHVELISAKTKVAPIKQVSIPRLELCAAVLLTRLMTETAAVMKIDKAFLHAWTDSTVVLAWLNSHPSRWKVFVANRVSEIVSSLDSHHWAHVSTKCNPADAASRGQSPSDLVKNMMWFQGPEFLHKDHINYSKPKDIDTSAEVKIRTHFVTVSSTLLERFSSFTRMIRVIAYCKRFVQNLKMKRVEKQVGSLTTQELNNALKDCIRHSQREKFSEEIAIVKKAENLPKRSCIRALNPFIDEDGILRVGGRLENSGLSVSRKHPVLLPKDGPLTNLLVADAHKQTLHGGPQLMLCYLRNKYWILGAARLVKQSFRRCVTCVKHEGKTGTQLMGQLPLARSTPSRPFKFSGVDYAGPIQIRTAKGRGHQSHKGYICLFVCMSSRAIHLEVVSSLTTEGFLQAFKRFVSRRGYCTEIWSDNGTNFTGAANELKKLFKNEKGSMIQEISETLASNGCSWNFIPARSPHFGGLWEAGIKSVKYHLKRIIGQSTLTFEEMTTVLAQVEACLNSRPLSVVTGTEATDVTILTPGHFLIGEPLVTPPDQNFEGTNISSLRRWQYTQRMTQDFWRQWSQQYLTRFYKRHRWSSTMPQPRIGDIVVVREDNLPPCRWLYGRVIDTHPGQDNLIRVVTLKVKNGTIKRAVGKLCLLPITDN